MVPSLYGDAPVHDGRKAPSLMEFEAAAYFASLAATDSPFLAMPRSTCGDLNHLLAHQQELDPDTGVMVNAAQRSVLVALCAHRIVSLQGSAGTGKTQAVLHLLKYLSDMDYPMTRVLVLAPTGKAVQVLRNGIASVYRHELSRLGLSPEMWGGHIEAKKNALLQRCSTVKKALEFRGQTVGYGRGPVRVAPDIDLVVIDESSMLCLDDLVRVLTSFGENARFLFVGDAAQLPSIDGAVGTLELAGASGVETVTLAVNYRAKSNVARIANDVREGRWPGIVEDFDAQTVAVCALETGAQVLASTHAVKSAVEREMTAIMNDTQGRRERPSARVYAGVVHEGDRVVLRRNRYGSISELCGVNGEVATICAVDLSGVRHPAGRPCLVLRTLGGETRIVSLAQARNPGVLDFAWALTIHAAQGDQFEDVLVCIGSVKHQDHTRSVSSRNNLYTAVSRARRSVRVYVQSGVSLPEILAWNSEVCVGELANAWRQDGRRQGRRLDEVPDATDYVAALPDDAPMALRRAAYYLNGDRRALYAWKTGSLFSHR